MLSLVLLKFPWIGGRPGRSLDRPPSVTADKDDDSQPAWDQLGAVGIEPHIPHHGDPQSQLLGAVRWPIERTLSWLKPLRRLQIGWDRRSLIYEVYEAFLPLGCLLIAWRSLQSRFCPLARGSFKTGEPGLTSWSPTTNNNLGNS